MSMLAALVTHCRARLLGAIPLCGAALVAAQPSAAEDGRTLLTIDHYVPHVSTV
ncbi:MAG TPA: hypothetical protein VF339_03010 [Gammaproteobacteria bacterium]